MHRFGPEPFEPAPQDRLQAMAHRLQTREGQAWYAWRKSTVEPVIGIIKSVMKFRQFLLRGVNNVRGAPLQPVGSVVARSDYPCVHTDRS